MKSSNGYPIGIPGENKEKQKDGWEVFIVDKDES
jgi:hypothetical protein